MKFRKNILGDYVAYDNKNFLYIDYGGSCQFDMIVDSDIERFESNRWQDVTMGEYKKRFRKATMEFHLDFIEAYKKEVINGL